MRSTVLVVILVLFTSGAVESYAATVVVTKVADTADGVCDEDCSLREALAIASSGDIINFSSLFSLPQTIRLVRGQLVIDKNLRIKGPGSGLLTLSGNNAGRIFYLTAPDAIEISGMRLTEGRLDTIDTIFGGAIYLVDGTLMLAGLLIDHNFARHTSTSPPFVDLGLGGGIYVNDGVLLINNSKILSNTGPNGGGIYLRTGIMRLTNSEVSRNIGLGITLLGGFTLEINSTKVDDNLGRGIEGGADGQIFISESVVSGNAAGGIRKQGALVVDRSRITNNKGTNLGGGIGSINGATTITDSVISGNSATGDGAGIYNASVLFVTRCTIAGNRATQSGGGIRNVGGQAYLTNTTLTGNRAGDNPSTARGGGIRNHAQMTITNSTIANNEAIGGGGGIYAEATGNTVIRNSIVANNAGSANGAEIFGAISSQGHNIIRVTSGSSGWLASDLLGLDPLLAPTGFNGGDTYTHALLPGSPAIDAGSNVLATDPQTMLPL